MANHKSAKKRAKQAEIRRMRNIVTKTKMKNAVKAVRNIETDKPENTKEILNNAKSVIAVSAKKGVIHKRAAARKISRLEKLVNRVSA